MGLRLVDDRVEPEVVNNNYGRTPLIWAAERDHRTIISCIFSLANNCVEPNVMCDNGHVRRNLGLAAENSHATHVKLFVPTGSNPTRSFDTYQILPPEDIGKALSDHWSSTEKYLACQCVSWWSLTRRGGLPAWGAEAAIIITIALSRLELAEFWSVCCRG